MRIQCDACGAAAASVVCCADEAALCARCDVEIHAANKLAGKHQRLPLAADSSASSAAAPIPRCDVCQERPAFIFCVEDRALLCRDCDEPIHVPGTLSANHTRFLATGIRVGFSSSVWTADALPLPLSLSPKGGGGGGSMPQTATTNKGHAAAQEVPSSPFLPPSGWAVEDLLQLSDYDDSSDNNKKDSPPLEFKDLEWFADIDLFHGHNAPPANAAAEVPELFASPHPQTDAAFYKATGGARHSKKPRLELPDDDEDYFIVPDLG
ncbi:hypothetical protein QOZ80_4BG0343670 [Eleusine coracana subsp. coracana]|nr:hypothetical protein QOZ80_4BG0343670 [Eleusine coracana subsp. coracana]